MPCPMPYIANMENCKLKEYTDSCGCQTRCQSYDCSNNCNSDSDCTSDKFCRIVQDNEVQMVGGRRMLQISECVDKVDINENCGGYTLPQFQSRCLDTLECVNTMGPMIADAPGQCKSPCVFGEVRDDYGTCITSVDTPTIPSNCATWYDGCNTCQVSSGKIDICTRMYCFIQNTPECLNFHITKLKLKEVCYRFCEDNSQKEINKKNECPLGSICKSLFNERSVSMIAYDSCNEREWTCEALSH